jgi:hypothetical protein
MTMMQLTHDTKTDAAYRLYAVEQEVTFDR